MTHVQELRLRPEPALQFEFLRLRPSPHEVRTQVGRFRRQSPDTLGDLKTPFQAIHKIRIELQLVGNNDCRKRTGIGEAGVHPQDGR